MTFVFGFAPTKKNRKRLGLTKTFEVLYVNQLRSMKKYRDSNFFDDKSE
jgi:hypothetical protein